MRRRINQFPDLKSFCRRSPSSSHTPRIILFQNLHHRIGDLSIVHPSILIPFRDSHDDILDLWLTHDFPETLFADSTESCLSSSFEQTFFFLKGSFLNIDAALLLGYTLQGVLEGIHGDSGCG